MKLTIATLAASLTLAGAASAMVPGAGHVQPRDAALGAMLRTMTLAGVRSSTLVLPGRALGLIEAEDAITRLLRIAEHHPEHDEVTLVEDAAGQRAMEPVLLRARRAAHAML